MIYVVAFGAPVLMVLVLGLAAFLTDESDVGYGMFGGGFRARYRRRRATRG